MIKFKPNVRKKWTPADEAKLLTLRAEGKSFDFIGEYFGRSPDSCDTKHREIYARDRRGETPTLPQPARPNKLSCRLAKDETAGAVHDTASEMAQRMEALRRRNLTAQILGDPPPGFSALDGRTGMTR